MDASSTFQDSLPVTSDQLLEMLTDKGFFYQRIDHIPLRTVADSKQVRDGFLTTQQGGGHIKNLYLRDRKKRNFLLVVEEDKAINLKVLPDLIASDRLSFGSADRLFEMLGVHPGAVSPFSLINDPDHKVQLVLDADLANQPRLFAHPLVNDMTLEVSGVDLMRFFSYTGHTPKLLTL